MDEKTARDYRDNGRLPSERKTARDYRTRVDPFESVWDEVQVRLEAEPRLKAKTLFEWLQEKYPGQYPHSTRRTFERRVAKWRSLKGPGKPVMFEQVHHPGRLAASDFTVMNDLRVTIAGQRFDHTLFHCVLTYSNVESVSLCFSESFECLVRGDSESLLGVRRCAEAASHRQFDGGGQQSFGSQNPHQALPGVDGSLRSQTGENQRTMCERKRRCGILQRPSQKPGGSSPASAGESRFFESRRLCHLLGRPDREDESTSSRTLCLGTRVLGPLARSSARHG